MIDCKEAFVCLLMKTNGKKKITEDEAGEKGGLIENLREGYGLDNQEIHDPTF